LQLPYFRFELPFNCAEISQKKQKDQTNTESVWSRVLTAVNVDLPEMRSCGQALTEIMYRNGSNRASKLEVTSTSTMKAT